MPNLNLSLDDLRILAESKGIKGYKSVSQERLIISHNESKPLKEKNFDGARTEKIRKKFNELRDVLYKPKIREIRKDPYRMENKKNKKDGKKSF